MRGQRIGGGHAVHDHLAPGRGKVEAHVGGRVLHAVQRHHLVGGEGEDEGDETAAAPATATSNAVDALLRGQDTSVGAGEDLTGGISSDDLDTLLSSGLLDVGTGADTGAGGEGADTVEGGEGGEETTGTSGDIIDQLRAAGVDVDSEYADSSIGDLVGGEGEGEGIEGADLTEGEAEERAGSTEVSDLLSSLGYSSTAGEDEDREAVASIIGDMTEGEAEERAGVDSLGNLDEDFVVTDKGTIKSTYSGEEGYFDADGNWVPYTERPPYTSGGTGGTGGGGGGGGGGTGGGTTTKTTTTTPPPPAQSEFDPRLLMALSALASGRQQAAPVYNAARIATKSPFGTLPYSDIVDAYEQIYGA